MEENNNPNKQQHQFYQNGNQPFDNNGRHSYLNDTGFEEQPYAGAPVESNQG